MNLVEAWRDLLRAEPELSDDEYDARAGDLTRLAKEALASGGAARTDLLDAFRAAREGEPDLRWALGDPVLPPAGSILRAPEEFRAHPEVRFDAARMPIRAALALPVAEDLRGDESLRRDPMLAGGSWYAGRPLVDAAAADGWQPPRRSDGRPLTHVVQVDLAAEADNQGRDLWQLTGLPAGGILQVFHDTETLGWDPGDDPTAWRVTWLPVTGPSDHLVLAPEPPGPAGVAMVPINAQVVATVPSPLDLSPGSVAERDRYERVRCFLEQVAREMNALAAPEDLPTPWDEDFEEPQPLTRLGGFGYAESSKELADTLADRLPLSDGDEHVLLLDLNPAASAWDTVETVDAFSGGRHLEVWMRRSDLAAVDFSQTWCVIRTDN